MATEEDDFQTHHEEYLEKQKEILDEELSSAHSRLVKNFLYDRREDLATSTARNYARELRYLIKTSYDLPDYSDDPSEWTTPQWTDLIRETAREREIGEGTKRNTCYATKKIIKYFSETPADASEIESPKITHSKIDPETVLSLEEVIHLIETTERDRDAAIVALLYEGALRRTAIIQLDVKNYITEGFTRIKVPDKSGVKTGQFRERPLQWSAAYLDNWMTKHPDPDNPDAPLFVSIRSQDAGKRLSSHSVYTMLKRVAEKSDIDKDRVHPHAFRHSRVTNLRQREDITKSDIETILGWSDSTPMHSRYSHTTSTEEAKTTARRLGVEINENEDRLMEQCPRCGYDFTGHGEIRYCPRCTQRITEEQPDWWVIYKEVAQEDDPIRDQYGQVTTQVPYINQIALQEAEHIYRILQYAHILHNNEDGRERLPDEYEDLSDYDDEKNEQVFNLLHELKDRIRQSAGEVNLEVMENTDIDLIKQISEDDE